MGVRARTGAALLLTFMVACVPPMPRPPTYGYGAPYQGTGTAIFVKDSRTDWDITEGEKKVTSEQALEASGDPEYETRRQIAKDYNGRLYKQARSHQTKGKVLIYVGLAIAVAGLIVGGLAMQSTMESVMPGTAMDGAIRTTEPSDVAHTYQLLGNVGLFGGIAIGAYGVYGALSKPPYYRWRTPKSMDRPAYIRQQIEPYNEKLGVSGADGPDSGVDAPALAPGQRKPLPKRPPRGKGRK